MATENITLYELLNLSISSPGQGAVNFRAMYTLLLSILRQMDLRDLTVCWSDTNPEESSLERPRAEGQPAKGDPEGRESPRAGTAQPGLDQAQETQGDERQLLELIRRIQKQSEQLQDSVEEVRRQQDKAAAVQSEWVKTLEVLSQRVEQAEKGAEEDERYVTWEAMKSAMITERESLQKGLVLTEDVKREKKDEDVPNTALDTSDTSFSSSSSPSKSRSADDSVAAAEITRGASEAPGPAPVPPLHSLSRMAWNSSMRQETVEALRDIGRLKQRCDELEEHLTALDLERNREHQELQQLKQLLHDRGSEDKLEEVQEKLDEQLALVRGLLTERDKYEGSEWRDSEEEQGAEWTEDSETDQQRDPERSSSQESDQEKGPEEQQGLVSGQDLQMDPGKSQGMDQKKKPERGLEKDPSLDSDQEPQMDRQRSAGPDQLWTEVNGLKKVVSQLRPRLHSVEASVKELRDRVEAAAEDTNQSLQDQLDALRGMLQQMMVSLTSQLSLQEGPAEEGSELSGFRHTALSLGSRLSLLFQEHEQLQDAVNALLQQQPATGKEGQNTQLVSGVQKAILHLQSECEKLHDTTRCLHEDNRQKQTHIEELYKTTEELEVKKADKNMVETEIRADKSALDSKVSRMQFDSVTEQLSNMFNELLTKITDQEQDWGKVMEKLSSEMDCKLNRIELDSVKKQLEARWKSIQERMKSEGALQEDDAAGIRKQLVERFHCLSCDRPVLKHTPGPQLLTLPSSPGLQPHRSMRPFSVFALEQIRQHYRSLTPGTNRLMFNLTNSSRKREQLQRSYHAMCRQIDRLREDHRSEGQSPPERLVEVADYSLYSVSRSCGGSHTTTPFTQRHRSTVQHTGPQSRMHVQHDHALGQSEEVDIVGLDGHIYKGRLNASRHAESKLPTIATKDGSFRNRGRPRSSTSPRESAPSPGQRRPSPPSGSCSPGRDWPVSALGCASQSSIVPMSVNAAGGSP